MSARICVIGGGLAGLSTAVALQRAGYSVTVIEQRADPASGSGISIWPNALAALDIIGVGDQVRTAGGRVTAGAIRWRDGRWLRRPSARRMVSALGEPLVVVRRSVLTTILRDALLPGTLETGVGATALTLRGTRAVITLSDGEIRDADAVVGADGVNSVVARVLNGPLETRYTGYTAWRGVAAHSLDPDLGGETLAPGTQVGHVPLGRDHTYWFATERAPEGACSPDGEQAHLMTKLAGWADPIPRLVSSTDPADLLRNDLYDRAQARHWSRGCAVIVGDAAHPMRPHLGQGGCQGIEDAAILARCIELAADLPTAFHRFGAFRKRRVGAVVREAQLIGRVLNVRPAMLGGIASRATALIPEKAVSWHLAGIASRSAFVLPTSDDVGGVSAPGAG